MTLPSHRNDPRADSASASCRLGLGTRTIIVPLRCAAKPMTSVYILSVKLPIRLDISEIIAIVRSKWSSCTEWILSHSELTRLFPQFKRVDDQRQYRIR